MKKGRKSPLKWNPLRNPGQSLDERINDLTFGDGLNYAVLAVFSVVIACLEWHRWYFGLPHMPKIYTAIALIVVIYSGCKIAKLKKLVEHLRLGRDGEVVVGQKLNNLKDSRCRVFHDLLCDQFNIDHVIVSEKGIFTIETKTYSKPEKGSSEIIIQGERVIVDGYPSDKISVQAKAEANWLQKMIFEATEQRIKVHPVVLFPGWYVDSTQATPDIWFLNPDQLEAILRKQPQMLTHDEVVRLTYCISQHIRTKSNRCFGALGNRSV